MPVAPTGPSGAPSSVAALAADTAVALQRRWTDIQGRIRAFQEAASLNPDGQYGPAIRGALAYWTGRAAPRPWTGTGIVNHIDPAHQRGDGSATARRAQRRAGSLYSVLIAPEGPVAEGLARFQRAAGLAADSKYGEGTRAALRRHGVANPPPAFRRSRGRSRSQG